MPHLDLLLGANGPQALDAARASRGEALLRRVERLSQSFAPELARAALAMDALRERAAAKLPHADRWWLEQSALEQGTAWPVALERFETWPDGGSRTLTDLTAGLGLDALAAATAGWTVRAVERDPERAALLRANVDALELSARVTVVEGDMADVVPDAGHAFLDPDRRPGGERTRDPTRFEPPSTAWAALAAPYVSATVKAPPLGRSANPDDVPETLVTLRGTLRERRLHYGAWGDLPRRTARVLSTGAEISGDGIPWPAACAAPQAGQVIVDPDAAVVAAGLVGDLAKREALQPIHADVPYLIGAHPKEGWAAPLPGHAFVVDGCFAPKRGPLQAWLDHRAVGTLEIRGRGVERGVAAWQKKLRAKGTNRGALLFTRDRAERRIVIAGLLLPGA